MNIATSIGTGISDADIASAYIIDPCTIILELHKNLGDALIDTSNIALKVLSYDKILSEHSPQNVPHPLTRTIFNKLIFAKKAAYFSEFDEIVFCLPEYRVKHLPLAKNPLFLAGEFNNWYDATKNKKFQLRYTMIDNSPYLAVKLPRKKLPDSFQFKFVTLNGEWIGPSMDAPNKRFSPNNICNFLFDSSKTGNHIIALRTNTPMLLSDKFFLKIGEHEHEIDPSPWLFSLYTPAKLGAFIENNQTTFRVFVPRAHSAQVLVYRTPDSSSTVIPMHRNHDYTWEITVNRPLHGQFYHYQALFFQQIDWNNAPKILDPYAKATCSAAGPGMILKKRADLPLRDNFHTQHIKDDVILEAHVRDLLVHAPIKLTDQQRTGFAGLSKWLSKKRCYLRVLGINALELQPIQETDAKDKNEYHWGYMPTNFFSPASAYTTSPKSANRELKNLIKSCHRANLAVILDVVYNHTGSPNHLYNLDNDYFFRKNPDGSLQNFSGCGNDLRTESPMVQRLILDSLKYFVTTYRVDGFRFDLAELLGREFLYQIEHELKLIKPDIQIIYEPWSFRNNIGHQLHSSCASAWNDEYREFIKNYVCGHGNFEGISYFLRGSLGFRTDFPAQSINYIASHDDRCWIDKITERADYNGTFPTINDIKRTHLALAIMMMSIGVPMLSAGQDMLFSKQGNNNTYQSGDINALNYHLIHKHSSTHKFFKRWIRFRLSRLGGATRLLHNPTENYLRFFRSENSSAIGVLYNADHSLELKRLFFAINPHDYTTSIALEEFSPKKFRKLSDIDKFYRFSKKFSENIIDNHLTLPPFSLGLWVE